MSGSKKSKTGYQTTFSIIIAVYNCEKYIIETLKSICEQTFEDYEVIIVDDCSSDNTFSIIEDYIANKDVFALYSNDKNMGVAFSRNFAIDKAHGEYICLLDGDDVWVANKLETQYEVLKDQQLDGCYTSYAFIDEQSKSIGKPYIVREGVLRYEKMLRQNFIGCSTIAIKSDILKNKKFSKDVAHEDYALWLKLIRIGFKLQGISKVLVTYRITKGSRSHNKIKAAINRFKIYRKCEKLSLSKSIRLFVLYSVSGIIKHWRL